MLTISTAATSRALLTLLELRAAAGVAAGVTTRDTELAAIGLTVADTISDWCCIAGDGLTPVTLLRETLVETFRTSHHRHPCRSHHGSHGPAPLILARRFLGTVGIVEDGTTLVLDTDFEIDAGAGLVYRLCSGQRTSWRACLLVATYDAGFATVPRPLASVASEMVGRKTGVLRDPLSTLERVEAVGVEMIERRFWVDEKQAVEITPDMASKLAQYATTVVG